MSANVITATRPSWPWARNPLLVDGTALPPPLLLLAKILVVVFFASGQVGELPDHFNPFLPAIVHAGSPALFQHVLQAAAFVAGVALLLNVRVRTAAAVLGLVLVVAIASSRLYYENNRAFVACLFVLVALSSRDGRRALIQYQLILLYLAAALNKTLAADWRNGQFFASWAALSPDWYGEYHALASLLPSRVVAVGLSWIAIVTEWLLVVAFAVRRLHPLAIWLAVAYHTGLFLFTGRTFGMFWFALLASFLAFARWPATPIGVTAARDRLSALAVAASRLDPERRLQVRREPGARSLSVTIEGREHRGFDALVRMSLCLPVAYLAFALVAAAHPGRWAGVIVVGFLTQYAYSSSRVA